MNTTEKILVIKLEDLSSFVLALAAMKQIRAAHPKAHISLLTTPPFGPLAKASGYFNTIDTGGDMESLALARAIRKQKFARVYDLDQSGRTAKLYLLTWPFPPPWAGKGALADRTPGLAQMHQLERNASLLRAAGIWPDAPLSPGSAPPPDLSWAMATLATVRTRPYILLVPGGPEIGGWPDDLFGELARHYHRMGYDTIVLGPLEDGKRARLIQKFNPAARDLTGRMDYAQIALLAAGAAVVVGNPTGILDLAVAAGAPTIGFYPDTVDLTRDGPRGHVAAMQAKDLSTISVAQVAAAAANMSPALAVAS